MIGMLFRHLRFRAIKREYRQRNAREDFFLSDLDAQIATLAESIWDSKKHKFIQDAVYTHDIALFATRLYSVGGHSRCLISMLDSLRGAHKTCTFLSDIYRTERDAPSLIPILQEDSFLGGLIKRHSLIENNIIDLYNNIASNAPKTAIAYIHPDDIVFCAVVSLLKKHTNIKILYFNHASHKPNLGMSLSDVILECNNSSRDITRSRRRLTATRIVHLQSLKEGETIYYPLEEIAAQKRTWGIPEGAKLSLSGGCAEKFFESDSDSEYFRMIKSLLIEVPDLYHVILTELGHRKKIVDQIFDNEELRKRLVILPRVSNFDLPLQCADVFIDSFPMSSALMQIELMRNKVPTVVKINKQKPELSFHEYMPPYYPYMFESSDEIKNAVIKLLFDQDERNLIRESNYEFWLNTYESKKVSQEYIKIMEEIRNEH